MKQLGIPFLAGILCGALIVDLFAGGGGASLGIEMAVGRPPDIAVNHDAHSIEMHSRNHPATEHHQCSVYEVDPVTVCAGRPVGLLWLSPDCRHFSRAKGAAPVSPQVRSLAWVGVDWARAVRPAVICLENVPEFQTWGPLDENNQPIKAQAGETFREFVGALQALGYQVEWRTLCAADYATPTIRRRLFLVARRDGQPITWPEPTHGEGRKPWRAAAECIDFSDLGTSIFGRKKPLAKATNRRIAAGTVRYVMSGAPFIVTCNHAGNSFRGHGVDEPMKTLTAARDAHGLVTPTIIGIGERRMGGNRNVGDPMPTLLTTERHALATAYLSTYYGNGVIGRAINEPAGTITAWDHHALAACHLSAMRGTQPSHMHGEDAQSPLRTISAGGQHHATVACHLVGIDNQSNGTRDTWAAGKPLTTITRENRHALAAASLVQYYSEGETSRDLHDPMGTVVTKARHGLAVAGMQAADEIDQWASAVRVGRWLLKYAPDAPVSWLRRNGRLCPVVSLVVDGVAYVVTDIALRMLKPRELARAQGFPDAYQLTGTQAQQIARIGNSVCPPVAAALVAAQFGRRKRVAA
jgi:DNA (cytosine-5)-methyltransferase 1